MKKEKIHKYTSRGISGLKLRLSSALYELSSSDETSGQQLNASELPVVLGQIACGLESFDIAPATDQELLCRSHGK